MAFGDQQDFRIYHDGTDTQNNNFTGNLVIKQQANDKDIIFQCDDGAGNSTTYFYLDGSLVLNRFLKDVLFNDDVVAKFGTSSDLRIYHNGTNNFIEAYSGNLIIQNHTTDSDIIFKSDNGTGGTATYFYLDGSLADGTYTYTRWVDYSVVSLGTGNDLQIFHDSTKSRIENLNGNLEITQKADDSDIIFQSSIVTGKLTTL